MTFVVEHMRDKLADPVIVSPLTPICIFYGYVSGFGHELLHSVKVLYPVN